MMQYQSLQTKLPHQLQQYFCKIGETQWKQITEIRMRISRPIEINFFSDIFYLSREGNLLRMPDDTCVLCTGELLSETFLSFCNHSVYAYEESLKCGYLTLAGGHRVGVAGKCIYQNGKITGVQFITSLNIRVARTDIMMLDSRIKDLLRQSMPRILIAGEPKCGKTTLLRAIAKEFSSQKRNVTVIDERMELWPCDSTGFFQTPPLHCDVLSGYTKGDGMEIALRCLAPELFVCDEIGTVQDVFSAEESLHAGTGIVASVHAANKEDILYRPVIRQMLQKRLFDFVVLMKGRKCPGRIEQIAEAHAFL